MARSQKPRKRYDPTKWLRRTVAAHAARIEANPLTDDQQRDLGLAYWLSFQSMLTRPAEEHWHTLACTLNIALVLVERGFGAEYIDDIKAAQAALMRTQYRQSETGSWALDSVGIAALRQALALHDAQMKIAERGEARKALMEVDSRIRSGEVMEVANA